MLFFPRFTRRNPDFDKIFPDMKLRPSLLVFSFIGIAGIFLVANNLIKGGNPEPDPRKEAVLVRTLLEGMARLHFQPKQVDDKFSTQLYNLYLEDLDGGKRFLTQAEVDRLAEFETKLDDQMQAGTFQFFNLSVELADNGVARAQQWYREILAKPFDFSKNDFYQTDGKKISWAKDEAELHQRWEVLLKYDYLQRFQQEIEKQEKPDFKGEKKSAEALEKETREKMLDSYDKWFKQLQKADRGRKLEVYLNSITNVFDPHSNYFSPKGKETFDFLMSGKLEGIGARLMTDGEKTSVTEIVPGGPAWKHGELQPKDIVLKVGQGDETGVDVTGWDIDDVVGKIRGPKGTKVTLTVQKADGSIKTIAIVRDVVILEEGLAKSLLLHTDNTADKVGYIYLPKFYADFTPQGATSCALDVAKEIDKLKRENVKGIILDLRNNGGGSLRDVVQMSGYFIEQGPIVQVKSRNRKPEIMEDNDARVQWGGPLIVMVNGFSASASEILAAAMQDYGRALIVGATTTYGKGTVQRFLELDNATNDDSVKPLGTAKITVQKFYRITGKTTQLDGATPDIVLPDSYNLVDLGERDNAYPLESDTIAAVPFSQNVYRQSKMDKIREASRQRVSANPVFQKIAENAERLRRQKDNTAHPVQREAFLEWDKKQESDAKRFDDMFQPISAFVVENLGIDMPQIQSDSSRIGRNDSWIKERKKDLHLYESLLIMQDMIREDAVAGKQ